MVCLMTFLLKMQADIDHNLYLDMFSKSILLPKTRPEQFVIDFCGAGLSSISASEFRDHLLPNIKKSLLRSPEVALFGIVKAIQSSKHSLDDFVNDLLKGLTSSITSTSEEMRMTAIAGVAALATMAEAPTVEKIVNYLFEQLTAAKSSEQRVSILDGVASCADAKNASSSALEKVANGVIAKATTPDKEGHENVVAAQWNSAFAWAKWLSGNSSALAAAFKSAPLLLSAVRHIGYRTLAKIFSRCEMKALPAECEKQLWQEFDAVHKEPLQFISLSLLLMKSSNAGTPNHSKVWEKVSVYDGVLKDRALSAMSTDDAFAWVDLTEKMILERPISNTPGSYPPMCLKSMTILLFWPHWQVRKRSSLALERILTVEESHFAEALADVIFTETINGFVDQTLRKVMHCHQDPLSFTVPGEWYVQALRLLLTPKGPEIDKLAIHTLLLASVQRLVEVDGSVWLRWMRGQASTAHLENSDLFKETAIKLVLRCSDRGVRDNALITLVALNFPSVREALWSHIEKSIAELDVSEYVRIPEKHVLIYQCSEGHLYNTEVLEFDEGEITYNMRRENKAYSFRDQVAEMQLRRELAEKKRKEGKLTAAQKQVMEKELAKEKEIRDEMRQMYVVAEAKLDEARAMVAADHAGAMSRTNLLFDYCIPLTRSYLVSKNAAELFFAYRDVAFPHTEDYLDELLGSTILRVIGAHWHVTNWHDEPLNAALQRRVADTAVPELYQLCGSVTIMLRGNDRPMIGYWRKKGFRQLPISKLRKLIRDDAQANRLKEGITEVCKDPSSAKKMVCLMTFLLKMQADIDHNLYLDMFSKSILLPKTRPEQFVIDFCGAGLSSISASEFRDHLLPNIKKSLLRSPEVALFGIVKAIQSSKHSLDDFVNDLLKGLTSSITSTSEEMRMTAIAGVAALATMAEAPTVEKIVNYLFEQLTDELLGSTILRVIGAHWHVTNWHDEPLNAALQRSLQLLNERAFVVETGDEDDTFVFEDIVGATQLTVLYPMIRELLSPSSHFGDDIREATLTLLQNAIHRRFLKDNAVLQLPMNEYATLLLSEYARNLSSHSRQALVQLVSLANETEDTGPRVVSLARSTLNYLDNDSCDLRENVIKVLSAPQLLTRLVLSSDDSPPALIQLKLWPSRPLSCDECVSEVAFVRDSAAGATAAFVQEFPDKVPTLLDKLDEVYTDLARIRPPVFDEVGRMVSDSVDEWARRSGVGRVLGRLADHVESKDAMQFIKLVVPQGLADRHPDCRNGMRDAAVEVIRKHGRAVMNDLLPFLEHLSDTTPSGGEHDNLRQGLVVLLGSLAQYLDPSSDKVRDIVARLMEALSTPSQPVQESVSRCLSPLVPAIRDTVKTLIQKLQWLLFEADSYGERRGAAYGIAGIVKGMGVSSLKELDLLPAIQKALLEKKNAKHREGGLLALEILCSTVGKLFEPYMIQALPSLLLCFGDSDENVRKAAEDTAVAMMSSMSPHGTKAGSSITTDST
ncbi:HEAT repeat protein [Cooperia oncophora]